LVDVNKELGDDGIIIRLVSLQGGINLRKYIPESIITMRVSLTRSTAFGASVIVSRSKPIGDT